MIYLRPFVRGALNSVFESSLEYFPSSAGAGWSRHRCDVMWRNAGSPHRLTLARRLWIRAYYGRPGSWWRSSHYEQQAEQAYEHHSIFSFHQFSVVYVDKPQWGRVSGEAPVSGCIASIAMATVKLYGLDEWDYFQFHAGTLIMVYESLRYWFRDKCV